MPSLDTCVISGVIYKPSSGAVAANVTLHVRRFTRSGSNIAIIPFPATSDANGAISITVPRNGTVYLAGNVEGLNTYGQAGKACTVPDAATATLESVIASVAAASTFSNPMTALGDLIYGGNSVGGASRLAGNITTTRKFLRQQGDGTNSALPAWDTLTEADIPSAFLTMTEADLLYSAIGHNHSGVYQPADVQLDSLAGLAYAGNSLKVIRVSAAEDGFELAAGGGGGSWGSITGTLSDQTDLQTALDASLTQAEADALYSLLAHNHSGVYEPANANIQSHISSTSNPHSVTAAQVGAASLTGIETLTNKTIRAADGSTTAKTLGYNTDAALGFHLQNLGGTNYNMHGGPWFVTQKGGSVGKAVFNPESGSIHFAVSSDFALKWYSGTDIIGSPGSPDSGIARSGAGVMRISDGTTGGGSLGLGGAGIAPGASGTKVLVIASGTAPTASPVDVFQLYSADWNGAGTAAPFFRGEEGAIHSFGNTVNLTPATALTNTINNAIALRHESSGTPAAGFGTGLLFQGESSTMSNQDMAQIASVWTTATHASRASKMTMSVVNASQALAQVLELLPTALNLASGVALQIDGTQVVGPRQSFIADPSAGAIQDAESRTAIAAILDLLIAHGLMAAS